MGPLTPIIGLRLLALAAGLRHDAEIGQPGLCFSAYGHKFGINHLEATVRRWAMKGSSASSFSRGPPRSTRQLAAVSVSAPAGPNDPAGRLELANGLSDAPAPCRRPRALSRRPSPAWSSGRSRA